MNFRFLGEKARDIITDIVASWYNYVVAHSLKDRELICWAITASYYSMMLATRGLVTLLVYESIDEREYKGEDNGIAGLRKHIRGHSNLIEMLKDDKRNVNRRNWWNRVDFLPYKSLLERHGYLNSDMDINDAGKEMTSNIGRLLESCKAFRENSSYDTYLIMAQHWRGVITDERRFKSFREEYSELSDKILEIDQKYLQLISEVLIDSLKALKNHAQLQTIFLIQVQLYASLINELDALLKDEELLCYKVHLNPISERCISEFGEYQTHRRFSETFNRLKSLMSEPAQSFLKGFGIPASKTDAFETYGECFEKLKNAVKKFKGELFSHLEIIRRSRNKDTVWEINRRS